MLQRIKNKLFCSHRHDINDHPQCFAVGNVNPDQAHRLFEDNGKPWYHLDGLRIGYFDIESDGLKADFSTMLSWAIKEKDGDTAYDVITKEDIFSGDIDKRIVASCVNELMKYKIIVSYFGTGFDLPYVRAKALHYGLYFPSYIHEERETKSGDVRIYTIPELYHFDLYYLVKAKLCLSRKSLDNACDYLGIKGKTPISKDDWRKAKYGDKESLEEVVRHNVADVEILEQLHNKLEPFSKFTRRSV